MVQWLGFCASIEGSTGSIPGPGAKILHGAAKNKGLFSGKKNGFSEVGALIQES